MTYENAQVKSAQVLSEDHNVVLDISNNGSEAKKYLCAHCNTKLIPFTREDKLGGYLWPNQQPVKKANRFETPGPSTDEHGNVLGDSAV
jgi:hypothetical protein